MPIIFEGNEKIAYRDPACYCYGGEYHLFFTVSEKENGYMFNYVAHSVSSDLKSFSERTAHSRICHTYERSSSL